MNHRIQTVPSPRRLGLGLPNTSVFSLPARLTHSKVCGFTRDPTEVHAPVQSTESLLRTDAHLGSRFPSPLPLARLRGRVGVTPRP